MSAAAGGPVDKVLLLGIPGAGTTTVGRALAGRLAWPYVDGDALLQRSTGSTAALLAGDGPAALQAAQGSVLTLLLGMPGPLVGSLPAGVLLEGAHRGRLDAPGLLMVWVRASAGVLLRRSGQERGSDDTAAELRRQATLLDPLCATVAHCEVDADLAPAGALARSLAELVCSLAT